MKYLQDVFFADLNVVYRMGGFFRASIGQIWQIDNDIFNQNIFYFITKGSCRITIDGCSYIGQAGQWFFIPAGTCYSYCNFTDAPFEKYWVHFDLYPNTRIFELLTLTHFIDKKDAPEAEVMFQTLTEIGKSDSLTDKIEVKAFILRLLAAYIKSSTKEVSPVSLKNKDELHSILAYINEHLQQPLPNSVLADIFHMHPNHFIRYFREKIGHTPQHYIMMKRMETAKRLLEQTNLPMASIAEAVGLCDSTHLSKSFKHFYGTPPNQYRKYIRGSK